MTKVPSLNYDKIVHAFERDGWRKVAQRGSQIKMKKFFDGKKHTIMIPAHKPVKRSTLSKILKQADVSLDRFLKLL